MMAKGLGRVAARRNAPKRPRVNPGRSKRRRGKGGALLGER